MKTESKSVSSSPHTLVPNYGQCISHLLFALIFERSSEGTSNFSTLLKLSIVHLFLFDSQVYQYALGCIKTTQADCDHEN